MKTKRCSICKIEYPATAKYFYISQGRAGSRCRPCDNARKRPAYYRAKTARYWKAHPQLVLIRSRVANALKKGTLQRQPCTVCGAIKVEAHHMDYNKPLDVTWLCKTHHLALHRKEKERPPRPLGA